MGTPDFAVETLKALIAAGHEIACVYSQPPRAKGRGLALTPTPVHAFAEAQSIEEAEKLADAKGTNNYKAAADVLADLREAIGGDEGRTMTHKHAAHLAKKYPTLNHLKSQLRKRGFLS